MPGATHQHPLDSGEHDTRGDVEGCVVEAHQQAPSSVPQ